MAAANGSALYNYVADSGEVHVVRLGDGTLTLNIAGNLQTQPAGPPTSPFWAKTSRGATEYGLLTRKIGVCITGDPLETGLDIGSVYKVPVLDPTEFAAATINSNISYQGIAGTVTRKFEENIYPGI